MLSDTYQLVYAIIDLRENGKGHSINVISRTVDTAKNSTCQLTLHWVVSWFGVRVVRRNVL
ncbi:hypothetical protein XarbCFBP7610_17810 [Xanthomonas arboricola]|nr:hypothetical protein XarbCFBP7610_17810 [Xanthomonas arboricola]